MKINDNFYMKLAIDEAWKYQLLTYPNPAVGCVIVKDNAILAIQAHKEAGMPHAEISALKEAYLKINHNSLLKTKNTSHEIHNFFLDNHNNFFSNCNIYVTLEPCNHEGRTPSCAKLLEILKPNRVIISVNDPNKKASGGIDTLKKAGIKVELGVLKKDGINLLLPFEAWNRSSCVFFKMAQTLNGSINGKISSNRALAYVHALRDKIDLIVVGGNTVRTDRPTLDSRYIKGKNPNVFIFSNYKIFDNNIPLFKIKNRQVTISNDISKIFYSNFVMIEGTYKLLENVKNKINFLMLIVSPKIRNGENYKEEINTSFEIIHENFIGEDKIIFLKVK